MHDSHPQSISRRYAYEDITQNTIKAPVLSTVLAREEIKTSSFQSEAYIGRLKRRYSPFSQTVLQI
jgi:hypothetical protein